MAWSDDVYNRNQEEQLTVIKGFTDREPSEK